MFETFRNAYTHRDLILSFAVRDIKARYKQTAPGSKFYTLTLAAAQTTSNKNFGEKRIVS